MKVCVISLPRAGSSTLCKYLATKHNLKNVGEIYRDEKVGLGIIQPNDIIFKLVPQNVRSVVIDNLVSKVYTLPYVQKIKKSQITSNNEYRHDFAQKHHEQIFTESLNICREIIKASDKHYFLQRIDLKSQILSFAAFVQTLEGGRSRDSGEIIIRDDVLTMVKNYVFLLSGIPLYNALHKEFGGEVIYTESLPELTGYAAYSKYTYIYNADILSDVEKSELYNVL